MKFELYRTWLKQYRWRLRAGNGEIVASGESYWNHADCFYAIELVRGASSSASIVDLTKGK